MIVAAAALLVRLVFLSQHAGNPTFDHPIVDPQLYDTTARTFVQSGSMGFGFFWQPFFYPLSLSAVYAATGGSMLAARLFQLAIGVVTCVLVYRLGRRIFDERIGLVAGLITASYGPLIFCEAELVGAGWAAFAAVTLMLTLLWAAERHTLAACFLAGLCGALSIIIRPTCLLFFLTACAYLLVVLIHHRQRWIHILMQTAAGVLGFALIALPVAAQCSAVTGHFSLLPAAGGLNMYIGNNPDTATTLTIRPGDEWTELQNEAAYAGCQTPQSRSRFFYDKVHNYVTAQPLAYAQGLLHKTAQFVTGREVPRNTDVYVFHEWSALLRVLVWKLGGFGFPWTPLLALAVVGLVFHWRNVPVPVKFFVILQPAAIVLVFVADRYRVETVPIFAVLAAAGVVGLVRQLQHRLWRPAALACSLALVVAAVTSLPAPAPEERINYSAEMFVLLADSVHEKKPEQAVAWYEEALRRDPGSPRAHCHLAATLAAHNRLAEAMPHFQQALQADSGTPFARALVYYERGKALMDAHQPDDALVDLNTALALYPRFTRALCRRGEVLYQIGRISEAAADWRRVLEVSVTDSERRYARARLERLNQPQPTAQERTAPAAGG